MKRKNYSLFLGLLFSFPVCAQQPVKFETVKIAEAIALPPTSIALAYEKTEKQEGFSSGTIFTVMESRFNQIFTGIAKRSARQIKAGEKSKQVLGKAQNAGINEMSPKQMETYLKQNPALQKQIGVDPSALELAAKMQDPLYQKKLQSMSNEEKMAVLGGYAAKSGSVAASKYDPGNVNVLARTSQIVQRFNEEYHPKNIEQVEKQTLELEEKTDSRFGLEIDALQQKLDALPSGKGISAAVTAQRINLYEQIKRKKIMAFETKLKGYGDIISGSISLFKISAAPFDQWMAKINYGDQLQQTSQTALLSQLGGYQEGYFRMLQRLHELSKDITLRAAAFYKNEILPGL